MTIRNASKKLSRQWPQSNPELSALKDTGKNEAEHAKLLCRIAAYTFARDVNAFVTRASWQADGPPFQNPASPVKKAQAVGDVKDLKEQLPVEAAIQTVTNRGSDSESSRFVYVLV